MKTKKRMKVQDEPKSFIIDQGLKLTRLAPDRIHTGNAISYPYLSFDSLVMVCICHHSNFYVPSSFKLWSALELSKVHSVPPGRILQILDLYKRAAGATFLHPSHTTFWTSSDTAKVGGACCALIGNSCCKRSDILWTCYCFSVSSLNLLPLC